MEEDPPEIVDIRFARHDTCERVVIDFDRTAPRPTTRLYLTALEEALGDTGCWDLSDRLCDLPRTPAAIEVTFGEQPVALRDGVAEGDVDGTDFSLPACPLPEELVVIKDCLIYTNYGIGTKGLILGTNDAVAWSVRVLDNKVVVDVSTVVGVPVG